MEPRIYREISPEVEAVCWKPTLNLEGVIILDLGARRIGFFTNHLGVGMYVVEGEWLLRMPGAHAWEKVLTDDVFHYRYVELKNDRI